VEKCIWQIWLSPPKENKSRQWDIFLQLRCTKYQCF